MKHTKYIDGELTCNADQYIGHKSHMRMRYSKDHKPFMEWRSDLHHGVTLWKWWNNKMHGLVVKNVGKSYNDLYSKICQIKDIDKTFWLYGPTSGRQIFLREFEGRYAEFMVNDDIICYAEGKPTKSNTDKIWIPYKEPVLAMRYGDWMKCHHMIGEYFPQFDHAITCNLHNLPVECIDKVLHDCRRTDATHTLFIELDKHFRRFKYCGSLYDSLASYFIYEKYGEYVKKTDEVILQLAREKQQAKIDRQLAAKQASQYADHALKERKKSNKSLNNVGRFNNYIHNTKSLIN